MILPTAAFAQTDPHHPDAGAGATPAASATPAPAPSATPAPTPAPTPAATPAPTTAGLPEQCMAMMPMMQQMMGMMQGGMMGGNMGGNMGGGMGGGMGGMSVPEGMSEASKAYMEAMRKMDAPMMTALQAGDPDVAFIRAMIPHHQGAIDMAQAVLANGKDEIVKVWATQIIKAQEAEIAEMEAWLKQHAQ
jgi:hypothetical protein